MTEHGCIYILTNPSFKEYVKIRYATNLEKRLKQLNRSETIPYAFRAYAILESIAKISSMEDRLKNVKPAGHEIADEKEAEENQQAARRGPLRFSECCIPVGAELHYVEEDSIVARVVDDRHIEYNGETTSLTALVKRLKGTDRAINGTLWFKYNGEILNDLRDRLGK